jgi:dTDP-4-amino-4,6-dideoxygalactose transaminase
MNSIQCDIAIRNFKEYDLKLSKLNEIIQIYNEQLGYINKSNHLYRISIDRRDDFISFMNKNGVVCGIHYESLHNHPVYFKKDSVCPLSEIESRRTVSIPFHEELTISDLTYIINLIKKWENDN